MFTTVFSIGFEPIHPEETVLQTATALQLRRLNLFTTMLSDGIAPPTRKASTCRSTPELRKRIQLSGVYGGT